MKRICYITDGRSSRCLLASLLLHTLLLAAALFHSSQPAPPTSVQVNVIAKRPSVRHGAAKGAQSVGKPPPSTSTPWQEELRREREEPLTSKRFKYSTFFKRIESIVLYKWRAAVDEAIKRSRPARGHVYTTVLLVRVNRAGLVVSVRVVVSAGVPLLDEAAAGAFKGAFLPNIPKGLFPLDTDTEAELIYSCNVQL